MIYARPFKVEDLEAFELIEPIASKVDPELAQAIEDSELAVTGIRNGEIVCCGGVHPIDDFCGELWLRVSKECLKHKFDTMRFFKRGLKVIEESYPFKQLDAAICFEKSAKMVKYFGFVQTQTITKDGRQWDIYSKRIK